MSGVRVRDRASGEIRAVDPGEAQRMVLAGQADLADRTVRVVGEGGRTGTVDASDFATEHQRGWRLTDEAGAQQARMQREAHSVTGQALGTVEALGRGATLGLSDMAATSLGADPEAMRARKDAAGGLATAAELGGAVLPIIVSGGTGAAATGARGLAAAAPTALAARAGTAAARALPGAGRLAGAARVGTAAAVEGGIAGAGMAVSEASLWDREITGEDLAQGIVSGALIGAGGAAATGAATRTISAGARGAGKLSAEVWERVGQAIDGRAGGGEAARKIGILDVLRDPKLGRAATNTRAVTREIATEVKPKYQAARKTAREIEEEIARTPGMLRKVDTSDAMPSLAIDGSTKTGAAVRSELTEVAMTPKLHAGTRRQAREAAERIEDALATSDLSERYRKLDQASAALQTLERTAEARAPQFADRIRSTAILLDDHLDNVQVWGKATEARRSWREAVESMSTADGSLPAGLRGKVDDAELVGLARSGRVDEGMIRRQEAFAELARTRELPKDVAAKIDRLGREVEEVTAALKSRSDEAAALELMRTLEKRQRNMSAVQGVARTVGAGAIVSRAVREVGLGIPVIGTIAAEVALRPASALRTAASAVEWARRLARVRSEGVAAVGRQMRGERLAGTAVRSKVSQREAIEVAKRVTSMSTDEVARQAMDATVELADVAPYTSTRAQATAMAAHTFLRQNAPRIYRSAWSQDEVVDPAEVAKYQRYVETVEDPSIVWRRLGDLSLTRDHVHALRTVYPATHEDLRESVMGEMGEAMRGAREGKHKPPPYDLRVHLGTLLEIPADPSLRPGHAAMVQASIAQAQQPEQDFGGAYGSAIPRASRSVLAGGGKAIDDRADRLTIPSEAHEYRQRS